MKNNRHWLDFEREVQMLSWKISDFTEQIQYAVNDLKLNRKTVSTWFNKLENAHIHYVNRIDETGEKIYDELDLEIGIYIKQRRNEKAPLTVIFNEIKEKFEVRPVPFQEETKLDNKELYLHVSENLLQQIDLSGLKKEIIKEIKTTYEEVASAQLSHIIQSYESLIERLPEQGNHEEERERRFQEMVLKRRVEYQLEKEAILLWTSQPESERFRKVGWFRKEEDTLKRDLFVKEYVTSHFAERIKKELFYEKLKERKVVGEVDVLTPAISQ
jgi:hypothetical protein